MHLGFAVALVIAGIVFSSSLTAAKSPGSLGQLKQSNKESKIAHNTTASSHRSPAKNITSQLKNHKSNVNHQHNSSFIHRKKIDAVKIKSPVDNAKEKLESMTKFPDKGQKTSPVSTGKEQGGLQTVKVTSGSTGVEKKKEIGNNGSQQKDEDSLETEESQHKKINRNQRNRGDWTKDRSFTSRTKEQNTGAGVELTSKSGTPNQGQRQRSNGNWTQKESEGGKRQVQGERRGQGSKQQSKDTLSNKSDRELSQTTATAETEILRNRSRGTQNQNGSKRRNKSTEEQSGSKKSKSITTEVDQKTSSTGGNTGEQGGSRGKGKGHHVGGGGRGRDNQGTRGSGRGRLSKQQAVEGTETTTAGEQGGGRRNDKPGRGRKRGHSEGSSSEES